MHSGVAKGAHTLVLLRRGVIPAAAPILARMPQALVRVDTLRTGLLVAPGATILTQESQAHGHTRTSIGFGGVSGTIDGVFVVFGGDGGGVVYW